METTQRSARFHPDDMPPMNPESAFASPPEKDKISARVAAETKRRLLAIVEIWKVQTRVEKELQALARGVKPAEAKETAEAAAGDVDLTYVIDKLLAKATQEELAMVGGFPDTPEKLAATLKVVEQKMRK